MNNRFLKTIERKPVDCTPIWLMRQAGRYLPEYRQVRQRAGSFLALCKTPELACEVTLQPLRRFPLDAAILFSDILTIPDAMGLGLQFEEGRGPFFTKFIRTQADVANLSAPDPELSLRYVLDAIRLLQRELAGKIPLIGFCGSPWTLAAYMVEGQATPQFPLIQRMLKEDPPLLHQLLAVLAESVTLHLNAQIAAGVQAVMLFDTWGGMLAEKNYNEFSLNYMRQIISGLNRRAQDKKIPVILFTKGASQFIEMMADSGCDVVGLDWEISMQAAKERIGKKVILQGNLDPACLQKSPEAIRLAVADILAGFGKGPGHVFNLGHGITPDVDPEKVRVLVDAVHELSRPYHE